MMATGLRRRVDDLGRIEIPKEIGRKFGIREGSEMNFLLSEDEDSIILRRDDIDQELSDMLKSFEDLVDEHECEYEFQTINKMKEHVCELQSLVEEKDQD